MAEKKEKPTKSDEIWNKIKGLPINLYALGGVTIESQSQRLVVVDDLVYLRLKTSASLPLIEEAIQNIKLPSGERLEFAPEKDYIVISATFAAR